MGEMSEVEVTLDSNEVPIVDAGPPHRLVVDAKTEGPNQVEHRAGRGAESGNVTGVRRNLGLDEHHMEWSRKRGRAKPACVVPSHFERILSRRLTGIIAGK